MDHELSQMSLNNSQTLTHTIPKLGVSTGRVCAQPVTDRIESG